MKRRLLVGIVAALGISVLAIGALLSYLAQLERGFPSGGHVITVLVNLSVVDRESLVGELQDVLLGSADR